MYKMKINVIIVVNDISDKGGVERVILNLIRTLQDSSQYNLKVITFNNKKNLILSNIFTIPIEKLKQNKFKKIIDLNNFFFGLLNSSNKTVIITTSILSNIYFLKCKFNMINCRIFYWEHSTYRNVPLFLFIVKIIMSKFNLIDKIILINKKDYRIHAFFSKKSTYIPNYYPTNKLTDNYVTNLDLNGFNDKKHQLIFVGRLEYEKRPEIAIKIVKDLLSYDPNFKLNIYGFGSRLNLIQKLINEYSLQNNVFIRGVSDNIFDVYKTSAFLLLTSRTESFSMVSVESIKHGCLPISFDIGYGVSDVLINEQLVRKDTDIKAFSKKIIMLAKNFSEYNKIYNLSYQHSKLYDEYKVIVIWEKLFNEN